MAVTDSGVRRFCNRCGAQVSAGDAFCWRCGSRLPDASDVPGDAASTSGDEVSSRRTESLRTSPAGSGARPDAGGEDGKPAGTEETVRPSVTEAADEEAVRLGKTVVLHRPHGTPAPGSHVSHQTGERKERNRPRAMVTLPPEAFDEPVGSLGDEDVTRVSLLRRSTGERLELSPPCVVGRGSRADCRIDGNDAISREHVRISQEDGGYVVRDLSSTNATYVDGRRISGGGGARLDDGSVIRLADEEFTFLVEG